jgi:hypothetical protein
MRGLMKSHLELLDAQPDKAAPAAQPAKQTVPG